MGHEAQVLASRESGQGMGSLAPADFEPVLLALVGDLLPPPRECNDALPVLVCGMAGARQGWADAGYLACPGVPPTLEHGISVPVADSRIAVSILPGICQAEPADVMRGEETQVAGVLGEQPDFHGVVILPGTHTKWVDVRDGQIRSFRTSMTGELFALLVRHSVLRFSVEDGGDPDMPHAPSENGSTNPAAKNPAKFDTFESGAEKAIKSGEPLGSLLFGIRAVSLLEETSTRLLREQLSGLLIGHEVAGMKSLLQERELRLVGDRALCLRYQRVLALIQTHAAVLDADKMTLSGLTRARSI